ncbi:MAG: hypothetical protein RL329_3418 [Bacteroidota bacterium]|jgi:hypothetical protein
MLEVFEQFRQVTFYTLRDETQEYSETDRFIERFSNDEQYKEDYYQIATLIEEIGDTHGAKDIFFSRHEAHATALPPNRSLVLNGLEILFMHNSLRLYCLKISKNIVILFNGGVKTSLKVQDSPDLMPKFRNAQLWVKKILENIQDKSIIVDNNRAILTTLSGDTEIALFC